MRNEIHPEKHSLRQDPTESAFFQNPYSVYSRLHQRSNAAPLVYWHDYDLWCFYGFDAVNAVLRDRRFGRQVLHKYSRETLGLAEPPTHLQNFHEVEAWSLLCLEPPEHTRLRKLVTSAFVSRAVEKMKPRIVSYAHELIDNFDAKKDETNCLNLIDHYATPLPARIIAEMIGVPVEHIANLLRWSNTMVRVYTMTQSVEEELAADKAAGEFSALVSSLIMERRAYPQDDLLSRLVDKSVTGAELSDAEIISTVILLLNAGHEATVHQTGNAVKAILESQWEPAELFKNNGQTQQTVQEIMRFDTPLHLFTRYALEEIELPNQVTLKPGEQIGILLGAANHDPQRFEYPERFDPFRKDGGHVSLGAGIHYCLGAVLAQLELGVAVQVLFERKPGLQSAEPLQYRDSFHFRGLDSLTVTV